MSDVLSFGGTAARIEAQKTLEVMRERLGLNYAMFWNVLSLPLVFLDLLEDGLPAFGVADVCVQGFEVRL